VTEPMLIIVIEALLTVLIVLNGFAFATLWERKLLGRFQARYGPNRAGPVGYMQPLADLLKLVFKEDFVPEGANRVLFQLAPLVSVITAVTAIAMIPFGDPVHIDGYRVQLVGANVSVGLLVLFALSGLASYALILGGWASGNKYSLLGAARSAAQLVSYEVAMGLSVVGVLMISRSLSLVDIVHGQASSTWYILFQPIGFVIFLIAAVAETNRAPFDLPEAESELVAGYHTEYAGMKFAMFQMGEYVSMMVISALGATLFLGGYLGPWLPNSLGFIWLLIKIVLLLFLFIWLRATLPRLRYDQLMRFGWKVLLPIATANLVITAIIVAVFFQK
jgi:NADH-quinone oxidoreductase subunit H